MTGDGDDLVDFCIRFVLSIDLDCVNDVFGARGDACPDGTGLPARPHFSHTHGVFVLFSPRSHNHRYLVIAATGCSCVPAPFGLPHHHLLQPVVF